MATIGMNLSTLYGPNQVEKRKNRSHSFSPVMSSKSSPAASTNNRTVPATEINKAANTLLMQTSANNSSVPTGANPSPAQPKRTLKKPKTNPKSEDRHYTLDEMCSNPDVILKLTEKYYKSLKYTSEVTQDPRIFDYLSDGVQ